MSKQQPKKDPAAQALGRKGGKVKSEAKAAAARENAKRPRKKSSTLVLNLADPIVLGETVTKQLHRARENAKRPRKKSSTSIEEL
jgi:hypothetical protein